MTNCRITVAIVVLNGAPVLDQCLWSVRAQTHPEIELIVIDGGSHDGTLAIVAEHGSAISYFISERDRGIYDAMNKALRAATGDWLIFLGADDILLDSLHLVAARPLNNSSIYYGDVLLRSKMMIYGGQFSTYRLMQQNLCHQSVFYPRSIYTSHTYDTAYRYLGDYKYNIELWGKRVPFEYVGICVSIYNDRGASYAGDPQFESHRLAIIDCNFGRHFYLLKRLRTALARFKHLRKPHGTA